FAAPRPRAWGPDESCTGRSISPAQAIEALQASQTAPPITVMCQKGSAGILSVRAAVLARPHGILKSLDRILRPSTRLTWRADVLLNAEVKQLADNHSSRCLHDGIGRFVAFARGGGDQRFLRVADSAHPRKELLRMSWAGKEEGRPGPDAVS